MITLNRSFSLCGSYQWLSSDSFASVETHVRPWLHVIRLYSPMFHETFLFLLTHKNQTLGYKYLLLYTKPNTIYHYMLSSTLSTETLVSKLINVCILFLKFYLSLLSVWNEVINSKISVLSTKESYQFFKHVFPLFSNYFQEFVTKTLPHVDFRRI